MPPQETIAHFPRDLLPSPSPPLSAATTSPLNSGQVNSVYGHAAIAFWVTVSITIAYWILVGLARIASAWNRGQTADSQHFWSHFQRVGFVMASAISGEKFASEPALLRFCTPSMRDVLFHTQWSAALGMVAVQWPSFAYPVFAQAAWSTLTYNITLTQGTSSPSVHWDPLSSSTMNVPNGFGDQILDSNSPLFIDSTSQNTLLNIPPDFRAGIESFALAVGVRPQDLFGISVGLFLIIVGGVIAISAFIWAVDWLVCTATGVSDERRFLPVHRGQRRWSLGARDAMAKGASPSVLRDSQDENVNSVTAPRAHSHFGSWFKLRFRRDSFHRDALCGNLVRVLLLFHLPVTIFSAYEFSRSRATTAVSSMVLGALSFAAFSLAIPAFLVLRLSTTKAKKLYDDTRTLLALGPLYNQYASGSQTFAKLFFVSNVILGVVVGSGQHSGTAQAIIILVTEVIASLWTSVYLPWGRGAAMGSLSFLMCVARIITGVLLVILSPTVSVGVAAGSWIASAILLIQAIIYGLYLSMLLVKIVEGILRLAFRIPFNRSRHTVDSGLIGILSLIGLFGRRRRKKTQTPRYKLAHTTTQGTLSSQDALAKPSYDSPAIAGSSRGPPSVLRAEQIGTPYREDADDETGHILGAWPPIGENAESINTSQQPKSGFTRVRGGRANFDSPYAIMAAGGSSADANSERRITQPSQRPNSPSYFRSQGTLPQGAMEPTTPGGHIRKKSETGIIGDFSALRIPSRQEYQTRASPPTSPRYVDDDDDEDEDDEEYEQPTRRWFGFRSASSTEEPKQSSWSSFMRGRNRSEGNDPDPSQSQGYPETPGPSRSFVVVRNKPQGSNRPSAE